MDFNELRRINKVIKINEMIKQTQQIQQIQQLLKLNALLKQIKDLRDQQNTIKQFVEENKDDFWRGEKPSPQELEILREQTGYDKEVWEELVRELLRQPPES